jgi:hypothetical protein
MTFKSLLKRLQKKHYPSVRAMAHALGIEDASRISRGQPFNVFWCLRLAQVTGENPTVILRAADKGDVAMLIESLYGSSQPLLTPEEQMLLEAFHALPRPESRQALIQLARDAAFGTGGRGTGGGTNDPGSMPPPTDKGPEYKMAPHLFQRRARTR